MLCVNAENLCCIIRAELIHAMQSQCIDREQRIIGNADVESCLEAFQDWLAEEHPPGMLMPKPGVDTGVVGACIDCLIKEIQSNFCSRCCHEGGPFHKPGIDPFKCAWDRSKASCGECGDVLLNGQPFDVELFKQFLDSTDGAACKAFLTACNKVPYPEDGSR